MKVDEKKDDKKFPAILGFAHHAKLYLPILTNPPSWVVMIFF